ncbi:helix-turn-helix domain-containing protein [Methylobacterium sp. P5_C11]
MKMMISRDRLREKIMADADLDSEAGCPSHTLAEIGMFLPSELAEDGADRQKLKVAFGVLVRQLRRRDGVTIYELSQRARVDEDEVRKIEHDPSHKPRPRTVHQLAAVFKVPERAMMKLSGATITHDAALQDEAFKFAARSDDMSKLSSAEQKALRDFIKFLAQHGGA